MVKIAMMTEEYAHEVRDMMRTFYASPAVSTNGSEEIFQSNIRECLSDSPYLEGYVFLDEGKAAGYAMAAKSFSTEFGRRCVWIEDLYLKPEYCGMGIGTRFLLYMEEKYADCILRLEVEKENERAVHTYRKNGFETLPYMEMKR